MLFNSYIFIFLFLPLSLAGWYALNHFHRYRAALAFLCAMSLWFYGYFHPKYLLLLLGSIAMNYALSSVIAMAERKEPVSLALRRLFLVLGTAGNLAVLFYFKYTDFFISTCNAVLRTDWALRHIMLPLGISFFTFQQISFITDRALGDAPHYPLLQYLTFVTFFPQLIAGPIVLYDEMIPQLENPENRRFQPDSFRRGVYLFSLGLAKKVLLADTLAGQVAFGYDHTYYLDALTSFLVLLSYAFELYFDFSGYCDMAMGIGWMFGITLPVNFDSPYRTASMKEFWQHWHITLQRFFTRYVYFPLGGSRHGRLRTVRNVMIVFLLSGFWHGAAWTFVLWGLLNGLAVVFDDLGILTASVPEDTERPRASGTAAARKAISPGPIAAREAISSGPTAAREAISSGPAAARKAISPGPIAAQEARSLQMPARRRYLLRRAPLITLPRPVMQALTFLFWTVSLALFRADSVAAAFQMIRNLFTRWWLPGYLFLTGGQFQPVELYAVHKGLSLFAPSLLRPYSTVLWLLMLALCSYLVFFRENAVRMTEHCAFSRRDAVLSGILFCWSVLSLSGVSTFLYFNF